MRTFLQFFSRLFPLLNVMHCCETHPINLLHYTYCFAAKSLSETRHIFLYIVRMFVLLLQKYLSR